MPNIWCQVLKEREREREKESSLWAVYTDKLKTAPNGSIEPCQSFAICEWMYLVPFAFCVAEPECGHVKRRTKDISTHILVRSGLRSWHRAEQGHRSPQVSVATSHQKLSFCLRSHSCHK